MPNHSDPLYFFKDAKFHRASQRSVSWIELFYDLVYVATLIQIGNFLSENITLVGFGQFLTLMFVIYWAWSGQALFHNRYIIDDVFQRFLIFIQIAGVATIGFSVSLAFEELAVQFALGYVLVRVALVVMYFRAYRAHPESRSLSLLFILGFSGGIGIWLLTLFIPTEYHMYLWVSAIVFEVLFFSQNTMVKATLKLGSDEHHLIERMGIFTIIVLGESFVKVLDELQGLSLTPPIAIVGLLAMVSLFALWWLYFSDTDEQPYNTSSSVKPLAWSYGHMTLSIALVAFGVGVKKVFTEYVNYPDANLTYEYGLLLLVALILFYLSQILINFGLLAEKNRSLILRRIVIYACSIGLLSVATLFVQSLSISELMAIVATLSFVLISLSCFESEPSSSRGENVGSK